MAERRLCEGEKLFGVFMSTACALVSLSASCVGQTAESSLRFERADRATEVGWIEFAPLLPEYFNTRDLLGPAGLAETELAWLGALTFGDPNSRSVAAAVTSEPSPRLYVDQNRDRQFSHDEQFPWDSRANGWLASIKAEYTSNGSGGALHYEHSPIWINVRILPDNNVLSIRTAGTMVGNAVYLGELVAARYEDRNANGCWFDADDRLFVDLNQDGRLNSFVERLPAHGMRVIRGKLVAIEGDPLGRHLALTEVTAKGKLIPMLPLDNDKVELVSLDASVASSSGFQFRIDTLGEATEVPAGSYRVHSLTCILREDDASYRFVFSSDRSKPTFEVPADGETSLALLTQLKLSGRMSLNSSTRQLLIIASMRTDTNLLLTNCQKGVGSSLTENRLQTSSFYKGRQLALGSSGFS